MTTVGLLGPRAWRAELDTVHEWADVVWGVDSAGDVAARVEKSPLDVLVTEGSVAFLTPDIRRLVPHPVARIIAVCESESTAEWASSLDGVTAVASIADVGPAVLPIPPVALLNRHEPVDASARGHVITVWGPVGAPGITSVAIALAASTARAGLRTVLCDADSRGSSIAIALAIPDEIPGLAAACRLAGRGELTVDEIRRLAVHVRRDSVDIDVLTGLPRAGRWVEMEATKIGPVIDVTRTVADVLIIDAGFGIEENEWIDAAPQRDGATRECLRRADAVVAVGGTDAVAMARLIRGLDDLRELCPRPIIVLNAASPRDGSDAADAVHRFTDHRVFATIPRDNRTGVEEALARSKGQNALWRDVLAVAGVPLGVKSPRRKRGR